MASWGQGRRHIFFDYLQISVACSAAIVNGSVVYFSCNCFEFSGACIMCLGHFFLSH